MDLWPGEMMHVRRFAYIRDHLRSRYTCITIHHDGALSRADLPELCNPHLSTQLSSCPPRTIHTFPSTYKAYKTSPPYQTLFPSSRRLLATSRSPPPTADLATTKTHTRYVRTHVDTKHPIPSSAKTSRPISVLDSDRGTYVEREETLRVG